MVYVKSITVGPKNIKIKRGTWYYDVYADVCPINATNKSLDWHSSNPNVASVNCNGDICGVSEGTATIYVTATDGSGVADFCNVTVQEQVKVHAVAVTPNEKTVAVGEQFSLSAQAYPETADNRAVRWSSDDTNIAQVKYQWGCITAKAVGTTKIHATATDGSGIDGYCTVTVKQSIPVTSITIARTHTMNIGDSYYIKPTILPTNATNKNVRWSSSKTSVVSVDEISGEVVAKEPGIAIITAQSVDSGHTSTCEVWVRGKTPVFLIHGRTSNSEKVWGARTLIGEGDNDHYDSCLYACAKNDGKSIYVEQDSHTIWKRYREHPEGGNLAYYLNEQGYVCDLNLFVFNYPNKDPVIHDARKFEKYIENLISYVRTNGTDFMKACFYNSREDYEANNYKINLVGHSMGGLVGRYYIENLGHDENVDKLITICTPHWGSGYGDASCISGAFHEICDHDLRFDSAMYGGSYTTNLDCKGLFGAWVCNSNPYQLTDELNYSKSRRTKYYAIAGIAYTSENSIIYDDPYNIPIETAEICTTYSQLSEHIQDQSKHGLYNTVEMNMYMDINSVGDNMVGFLSQIGWTEKQGDDYPAKRINFEKIFVIVDTMSINIEVVYSLHNKIPHRVIAMNKVYEYLNM